MEKIHKQIQYIVIFIILIQTKTIKTNDINNVTITKENNLNHFSNNLISSEINLTTVRYCTYRFFLPYPEYHFKLLSGWSCYNYAQPKWMKNETILKSYVLELNGLSQFKIPYIKVDNKSVLFDYDNLNYTEIIKDLHTEERFYKKWLSCAQTAMKCCQQLNQDDIIKDEDNPCPALWDGYTCYEKTKPETEVLKRCPLYLATGEKLVCNLESKKQCKIDGWNHQTEYIHCSSSFVYRDRHTFHVIVLSIATAFMIPSIIIFLSFDKLKVLRIALHRNVIIAIFIKNIFVIISKNVVILDSVNNEQEDTVMEDDGPWCRMLSFLQILSINLIFSCMTADAYHSHKTIARAFTKDTNEYIMYGLIAVASSVPTFIWLTLMLVNEIGQCWVVQTDGFQWVSDGYKYGCLAINLILLLDIIRVLFLKFRKNSVKHAGRALKATFILLCLFGIPLIVSSQRGLFNMDDCLIGDIYVYVTYSIEAVQGIFMSLFFCYLNREAINEIKSFWRRFIQHINEKRHSLRETLKRRTTPITQITQASEDDKAMELAFLNQFRTH